MQSVKFALLGLLAERHRHGYELKSAFESLMGGSWTLNIGQVYSTLGRMERDGLVTSDVVPQDLVPDRKVYELTGAGRDELERWLTEPADGPTRLRDEFYVKVLVHQVTGGRLDALVASQRQHHLRRLAELGRLRGDATLSDQTRLLIEGAALHVEADLRWLDLCEERLLRRKT